MADSTRWADIAEAGFVSGMRFLFWVYRHIGAWAFTLVSWPVVLYYYLTRRIARDSSLEYLQKIHRMGGLDAEPGQKAVFRHIRQFARSTIDKLGVWADPRMLSDVAFPDQGLLLQQLDKGEGAVLLGGHLGNIEICRSLSRKNPRLKLNILVHTKNADMFNRLLEEMEVHRELELVEVSEMTPATAMRLSDCVARGEFVAILADRIPVASRGRTQAVEFLGHAAEFPEGPYILASLLKCPVFTIFCTNTGDGYRISCRAFSDQVRLPRQQRKEALNKYARRYAKILEEEALRTPFQWFNFYPYWIKPE